MIQFYISDVSFVAKNRWYAKYVIFIRPSSEGTYYGMVIAVRPGLRLGVRMGPRVSIRPSVPVFHTFLLHAVSYWVEILHITLFYCTTDQGRVSSICVSFYRSHSPFGTKNTENTQFSALFSIMLWHIELKFCKYLCFTVVQINFEFRQFSSFFVGVMPLFGTYNTGNTQFSALSSYLFWHMLLKFCIWLSFDKLQIKFEYHQFSSIFVGALSLLELTILEIHSFPHFASIFEGVMPLFELRI